MPAVLGRAKLLPLVAGLPGKPGQVHHGLNLPRELAKTLTDFLQRALRQKEGKEKVGRRPKGGQGGTDLTRHSQRDADDQSCRQKGNGYLGQSGAEPQRIGLLTRFFCGSQQGGGVDGMSFACGDEALTPFHTGGKLIDDPSLTAYR